MNSFILFTLKLYAEKFNNTDKKHFKKVGMIYEMGKNVLFVHDLKNWEWNINNRFGQLWNTS